MRLTTEQVIEGLREMCSRACDDGIVEIERLRADLADKTQVAATIATERALLQIDHDRLRAERELLAKMMIRQSLATGHGDTLADLVAALESQIAGLRAERDEYLTMLRDICMCHADNCGCSVCVRVFRSGDAARKEER